MGRAIQTTRSVWRVGNCRRFRSRTDVGGDCGAKERRGSRQTSSERPWSRADAEIEPLRSARRGTRKGESLTSARTVDGDSNSVSASRASQSAARKPRYYSYTGIELLLDAGLLQFENGDGAHACIHVINSKALTSAARPRFDGDRTAVRVALPLPSFFGGARTNPTHLAPVIERGQVSRATFPVRSSSWLDDPLWSVYESRAREFQRGGTKSITSYKKPCRLWKAVFPYRRKRADARLGNRSLNDVNALERLAAPLPDAAEFRVLGKPTDFFQSAPFRHVHIPNRWIPGVKGASFTLAGRNLSR